MSLIAPIPMLGTRSEADPCPSPFVTVRLLKAFYRLIDTRGWVVFAATSVFCAWRYLNVAASRHLDHDELFTFYIAQAPSLRQLLNLTHTRDLHPPLSYLLVRSSFAIFGISSWSCRLPFLLAFLATGALVYFFVTRLLPPIYGLIATLILWSSPYAHLAAEARPYAMMLCFTTLVLVSWNRLIQADGAPVIARRS
jgi:uncharacterized membrane protein